MKNKQQIYISRTSEDIQAQYDMNLQEASMHVDGDEDFITQETTSRSSKTQVGVQ
jgi:hypothetical protein